MRSKLKISGFRYLYTITLDTFQYFRYHFRVRYRRSTVGSALFLVGCGIPEPRDGKPLSKLETNAYLQHFPPTITSQILCIYRFAIACS